MGPQTNCAVGRPDYLHKHSHRPKIGRPPARSRLQPPPTVFGIETRIPVSTKGNNPVSEVLRTSKAPDIDRGGRSNRLAKLVNFPNKAPSRPSIDRPPGVTPNDDGFIIDLMQSIYHGRLQPRTEFGTEIDDLVSTTVKNPISETSNARHIDTTCRSNLVNLVSRPA